MLPFLTVWFVLMFAGAVSDDDTEQNAVCIKIFYLTQGIKELAEELLAILIKKGKINEHSTLEWAESNKQLKKALQKSMGLGLADTVERNWTKQKIIPDRVLYTDYTESTLYEFAKANYPGDECGSIWCLLNDERNRLLNHLRYSVNLAIANFGLPSTRKIPSASNITPKKEQAKDAEKALDAIVPAPISLAEPNILPVRCVYQLRRFTRVEGEYEEYEPEPDTLEGQTEEEEALYHNEDILLFRYKKLGKLFVRTFPDACNMSITVSHDAKSITFYETGKAPIEVSII